MKKDKNSNSPRQKTKDENDKSQIKALKEQLARALADYDNLSKRVSLQEGKQKYMIKAQVISRLLPVFDMLYGAQNHLNDAGLALTIKELEDTLKAEGIEKIMPAVGDKFTEELHEVTEVVNTDNLKDNEVFECVLLGWKFIDGQVIRHAKVKVNKSGT